jgi:hypothetical protein
MGAQHARNVPLENTLQRRQPLQNLRVKAAPAIRTMRQTTVLVLTVQALLVQQHRAMTSRIAPAKWVIRAQAGLRVVLASRASSRTLMGALHAQHAHVEHTHHQEQLQQQQNAAIVQQAAIRLRAVLHAPLAPYSLTLGRAPHEYKIAPATWVTLVPMADSAHHAMLAFLKLPMAAHRVCRARRMHLPPQEVDHW